ncbi:Cell division and transport-associated protein TolR [Ectothiorhodospira mobilis]|uniref:Tol-Pal system protein TolR n=1 Tax=Ectothiorhodospira mobilis TaxID=195064 RepID=A0A1I4RD96_ECTMO|nr:protein TolR [Ectothiorhodospira mobilis]SFM50241.1 Cell division and transport-associated protein TolR [Ectothiorhodospira mobilis]
MPAQAPRRRRPKRRGMSEINVVPFIDVMLVLLIIFMVTAPLLHQGVEVDLPRAQAQPLDEALQAEEPIVVTVSRDGAVTLNQGPAADTPLPPGALQEAVQALLAGDPETPVFVRGDRFVRYGEVVDAMVTLQAAGAPRVGLITDPPDEAEGSG